jgi:hypothetical protein
MKIPSNPFPFQNLFKKFHPIQFHLPAFYKTLQLEFHLDGIPTGFHPSRIPTGNLFSYVLK